ncbi:uncharacterized protein LOC143150024 [Ptiloglossa arizonensis]|uniref:uncharacterized protein LOC143150024 n=1 Tax=Ptiloglossa arizonensis TaxID=3350558 RepID=UPI003FA0B0A2
MNFFVILVSMMLCIVSLFSGLANADLRLYKADCSKYLNCDRGRCFVMSCGPGTEFNPRIGVCDYPYRPRHDCHHG